MEEIRKYLNASVCANIICSSIIILYCLTHAHTNSAFDLYVT